MKITLEIEASLLIRAKAAAKLQRTTLAQLIEEGLEMRLASAAAKKSPKPIKLPIFDGKSGLAKGLKDNTNRDLYDAIEANK